MRKKWIVLLTALIVTACSSQTTSTETPAVVVSIETFIVPTATPDCLHTDGVTLNVNRVSDSNVRLQISGLQPGETPYITYSTSQDGIGSKGGTLGVFTKGADGQGKFTADIVGLFPLEGQSNAVWDIHVIHSRGVECVEITLP